MACATENSTISLFKLRSDDIASIIEENEFKKKEDFYSELCGGHTGPIYKCKFTHDNNYLLSCGADYNACLWDVQWHDEFIPQPGVICRYSGHLSPVWDIDVFSQFNLFVTASKDTTARLWSFDRLYPLRIYTGHHSDVDCVAFHPNGAYLATGSSDKTIRLWSVQSGDFLRLFCGHKSRIYALAFSPDGKYIASGGEDRIVKVWDIKSGTLLKELYGHTDTVFSLSFDSTSTILSSGGSDRSIKFWDLNMNSSESSTKSDDSQNELLLCSVKLEHKIYTIYRDQKNVFYALGAVKNKQENMKNQKMQGDKAANVEMNIDEGSSAKLSKNPVVNTPTQEFNTRKKPLSQSSKSMSTRSASVNTPVSNSSNVSLMFSNHDDLYEI